MYERKYNAAATVSFPLIAFSSTSFYNSVTTTMFAAGDVKISLDYAGFTNTATLPTHIDGLMAVLSLTAAELSARHIDIRIVDQTATKVWEDQGLVIETYGTTASQHAFDRNAATVQASLTADQSGVTIATVTNVTNAVAASLTANQAGVTIATVTNVTNGVNLTSTAILSNFAASATAQINAEVDSALADLSITANAINKIHSATEAANTVWNATQSAFVTAGTFGDLLDATISGITVSGSGDWTDAEKAYIRHALGVAGSSTAGATGPLYSISSAIQNRLDVTVSSRSAFDASADTVKASLTAAQTGVTIANVTTLNNLGASAAAQVPSVVWGATQSAYDVAGTFGGHLDATVSGISVSGSGDWTDTEKAYIRHSLGVPGSTTVGSSGPIYSISAAITARLDAAITTRSSHGATDAAAAVWLATQASYDTAGRFGALLDSTVSGISVGAGTSDWTASEKSYIRHALGVVGSTTAGSAGPLYSISSAIQSRLDAAITTRSSHSATDAASAVFGATLTSSSYNADTLGQRLTAIDNLLPGATLSSFDPAVTTVQASLTANQAGVTVANVSTVASVTNPVSASLTANQSGVTIATVTQVTNQVQASLTANQIGVTVANVTTVSNLGASATAQVNTEIVDVLKIDTIAEPSAGAPPATPTFEQAFKYFYSTWRNANIVTASKVSITNDSGATISTAPIADDGSTFSKGEFA